MEKLSRMVHWFAVCELCVLVHCCGACQVLPTGEKILKLYGVSIGNHLFLCAGRSSNFACGGESTRAEGTAALTHHHLTNLDRYLFTLRRLYFVQLPKELQRTVTHHHLTNLDRYWSSLRRLSSASRARIYNPNQSPPHESRPLLVHPP